MYTTARSDTMPIREDWNAPIDAVRNALFEKRPAKGPPPPSRRKLGYGYAPRRPDAPQPAIRRPPSVPSLTQTPPDAASFAFSEGCCLRFGPALRRSEPRKTVDARLDKKPPQVAAKEPASKGARNPGRAAGNCRRRDVGRESIFFFPTAARRPFGRRRASSAWAAQNAPSCRKRHPLLAAEADEPASISSLLEAADSDPPLPTPSADLPAYDSGQHTVRRNVRRERRYPVTVPWEPNRRNQAPGRFGEYLGGPWGLEFPPSLMPATPPVDP